MKTTYLITGASGFLGKELNNVLSTNDRTETLGRSAQDNITCDLALESPSVQTNYGTVIHNAGKAHSVPRTDKEAEEFFRVNYHGTLNLLTGLEQSESLPQSFVFISTVAVYGTLTGSLLDEEAPLNASDPYGMSKKMAEEAILKWGDMKKVRIGILRLPLVAGSKPPGNLGKMLKAQKKGYYFQIGKGEARRSMVSAVDVAKIIPVLAEKGGVYNLTDQYHPSFAELGDLFAKKLGVRSPYSMPLTITSVLATMGDAFGAVFKRDAPFNSNALSKMTNSVTFSDEKAKRLLNWQPQRVIDFFETLPKTDFVYD